MSTRLTLLLLLLTLLTAVFMRFYQLGDLPPGLYQDEAYNGLDALDVLAGQHALFFPNNNGREPVYIYLTAVSLALFGNTPFALRLGAAVVGALTLLPVYALATSWFGRRTGLLAAWLWAVTLWPIHLSRIGLRAILLLPLLALLFWLGTLAWRQQKKELWLAAGAVYGLAFYTYLPIRFTPLLLVALLLWLWWRGQAGRLWPGAGWFGVATAVVLSPLLLLWLSQPELILGRSGQVSILSPEINGGNLVGTLLGNIARALGMFIWQGDDILRHNPALRPVFDPLMALPFLLGLGLLIRQWRRLPHLTTLLWVGIMLGPTILAEDTPHFLRAVGVLPAALFITAVGLNALLPPKISLASLPVGRTAVVFLLLAGSLWLTGRDYLAYARDAETAFLFEAAARELAEAARADLLSGAHGRVGIEQERFWDKHASIRFLLADMRDHLTLIPPTETKPWPPEPAARAALYLWPHERALLQERATAVVPPALVTAQLGAWARGDLEPTPYPFYARYTTQPAPPAPAPLAHFATGFWLSGATVTPTADGLAIALVWTNDQPLPPPDHTIFVHLLDTRTGQLIAQSDHAPSQDLWPTSWWQPRLWVQDNHQLSLSLPEPYNPAYHQLFIGLYPNGQPSQRVPLADGSADAYLLPDTVVAPLRH